MRRPKRSDLQLGQALWWAQVAARHVRKHLAEGTLDDLVVAPPPPLPAGHRLGVVAVLRARRDTCLVRSAVLQSWDLAQGLPRDIVIGVTSPRQGFRAHAWLEGEHRQAAGFQELTRRPPP